MYVVEGSSSLHKVSNKLALSADVILMFTSKTSHELVGVIIAIENGHHIIAFFLIVGQDL